MSSFYVNVYTFEETVQWEEFFIRWGVVVDAGGEAQGGK
jgi:hypothetical protein